MFLLLGLCLMTVGCVRGFGTHKRAVTPMADAAGIAQVADNLSDNRHPTSQPPQVAWAAEPSDDSGLGDVCLTVHDVANPTSTADSTTPLSSPLLAQASRSESALADSAETSAPPTQVNILPKPPSNVVALPKLLERVVTMFGTAPKSSPEVLPAPQGVPADQQPPRPQEPGLFVPPSTTQAAIVTPNAAQQSVPESSHEPLITLHVDNIEVSKVMEMVSRQAKILNILVSPGVTGTVTLDLRDKTVDETLRIIARQCRLSVRREKDVIYISTLAESLLVEEDDLPVRVYRLNYVKSTDVQKMVMPLLSKKGKFTNSPDSDIGLASDAVAAGEKAKDVKAGGNAMAGGEIVIVQDYEQILKTIDRIIAEIDVQPIQVLIEAIIVSVKLNKGMELGVNFALLDGAGRAVGVAGSGTAINAAAGFTPASVLAAGGMLKGTPFTGTAETNPGLKFGFVDQNTTGFIRALETMGETKVLACPRLLVLNKQRAEIHLGDKLGYATTTQTQTSTVQTVQFQDVGTQLRLRPFVSSDGMVRLEVRPERSSGIIDADGIPQVNSAQVTSNVMVPDGATIVIGGLMESEVTRTWKGLPFLSRLPWVGYLFRETEDEVKKKELVVILTPRIWRPECPEGLNYVGRPRTLSLDKRTSQTPPEELRDAPSLYELTSPPPAPIGPMRDPPASTPGPIPMSKAASPVRR